MFWLVFRRSWLLLMLRCCFDRLGRLVHGNRSKEDLVKVRKGEQMDYENRRGVGQNLLQLDSLFSERRTWKSCFLKDLYY